MSYTTKYTIPFQSLNQKDYVIDIQENGYTGKPTELTGSATPIVVKVDDEDFLYTPKRFSTASIRIVGNDYLQRLYSTNYQQYRVNLKQGNSIVWTGFIKPELYTQDYTSIDFELEVECISAMSTLEYINYKQVDQSKKSVVTFWDLIKRCIQDSKGSYSAIYLPHVYGSSASNYNAKRNILEELSVSEQNFYDEDDKPMTLLEVLEEVCKVLNWTCVDWAGSIYFIDVDHTGNYHKYSSEFNSYSIVNLSEIKVQDLGFSGSGHTLDVLNGYNKVSVKTSNYNVGELFSDEDFDKLKQIGEAWEYTSSNTVFRKVFLSSSIYKIYQANNGKQLTSAEVESLSSDELNKLTGGILMKRDSYDMIKEGGVWKPSITNYSYEDVVQVRNIQKGGTDISKALLTFSKNLPISAYSDGAISINCSIELNARVKGFVLDNNMIDWGKTSAYNLRENPYFVCMLSIGDKYWNGTSFVNSFATFNIEFKQADVDRGGFVQAISTKTLSMPYDGLDGYIIQLPIGTPLVGELRFCLIDFVCKVMGGDWLYLPCFLKDLDLKYQIIDGYNDKEQSDRIYENVINEDYINELDEIEFKISSYNNDGLCHGKAFLNNDYLKDNLYSSLAGKTIRPEELLIERIINQYSATKYKLNQVLINDGRLNPLAILSDKYMPDKRFIITGGEIDYNMDSFSCNMIENGKY